MSIFLTQEIANIVDTELNDLAKQMYTDGDITTKFVFYGTADLVTYERFQLGEYELDVYEKITPFLLRSVNFAQSPEDYTRYEESFELILYGYENEKTDLERVFNKFTYTENTINRVVTQGIYRIEKSASRLYINPNKLTAMDGTLDDRIEGSLGFIWSIAEGVVTSDDIIVKIDGVEIPYNVLSINTDKKNIQSEPITATGINKYISGSTAQLISLNLPYLTTNAKLVELFKDVWNKKYNKKYTLTIGIGDDISYTEDVSMVLGTFDDPKPTILNFLVIMKRVQKQTAVYINDTLVPVMSFGYTNQGDINQTVKINEDSNKSVYLSSNFGISLAIALDENDSNEAVNQIMSDIFDGSFGTSYQIRVVRNTIDKTYNVILTTGAYSFEDDTSGTIQIEFTEEDVG